MGSCAGGGLGGLSTTFAERVELELVHAELVQRLELPPSREVFAEERRGRPPAAGRRVSLRETLHALAGER